MTPETAKRMLDEAAQVGARFIRLHPDTIADLQRDYPQDPTLPQFLQITSFGTPVARDLSVEPGKWVLDLP